MRPAPHDHLVAASPPDPLVPGFSPDVRTRGRLPGAPVSPVIIHSRSLRAARQNLRQIRFLCPRDGQAEMTFGRQPPPSVVAGGFPFSPSTNWQSVTGDGSSAT